MLLICFIIALIIGIIMIMIGVKTWEDVVENIGIALTICAAGAILVSLIIISINHIDCNAKVAGNQQIYDSLVYQYENDIYDGDILGKKELHNQIQKWNVDVAYYQTIQRDFWVGIYYPNIFDQFKTIPLK